MHLAHAAVLLLLLTAGCAAIAPDARVAPEPEAIATQPTELLPGARPSTPTSPPVAAATPAPAAPTPAQIESRAGAPGSKSAPATKPSSALAPVASAAKPAAPPAAATPAPAGPPALDLNALKEQLKETKAIGVFTKLSLKNQVDDLLQQFRDFYQGKSKTTMAQLRRSYDLLMMKVLSLLQDADQKLASAIVSSREAIWGLLSDPKKFATLET